MPVTTGLAAACPAAAGCLLAALPSCLSLPEAAASPPSSWVPPLLAAPWLARRQLSSLLLLSSFACGWRRLPKLAAAPQKPVDLPQGLLPLFCWLVPRSLLQVLTAWQAALLPTGKLASAQAALLCPRLPPPLLLPLVLLQQPALALQASLPKLLAWGR